MVPFATKAPPTPSTTRNAVWMEAPPTMATRALYRAPTSPAAYASSTASSAARVSRPSAPLALTVRAAPRVRSRTAPTAPTDVWERATAALIRGRIIVITMPTRARTSMVTPRRRASSVAIMIRVPAKVSTPLTVMMRPSVAALLSSVLSEVTRAMRSPGARWSSSETRSRISRCTRPVLTWRTTRSEVLCWSQALTPVSSAPAARNAASRATGAPTSAPWSRRSRIAWANFGWTRPETLARRVRRRERSNTRQCGLA